ncbi:MAG TPA: lysoplasmalogenase [Candidatus Aminicenantes bacterium]|nr:lysoplasmalogenase [Candidatus Aminicenantes bacterium]HRY64224.1 lysoplasmalogenase [Candidatus Aminicenantes bacterium]HRZ71137.1 lysoplasmalogenase [Candidatus Aminicenantes bacterium]
MSPVPWIRASILPACVLVSAAVAAWSQAGGRKHLYRAAKPLTMALIIAAAALAPAPVPAAYKIFILAGLACSLLGDIALMFPGKWFTAGLAAFLCAQGFYILAFKPGPGQPVSAGLFLPFILYGLLMFFILAPGLGPMKLPVLVYIAAAATMAGFAAGRFVDLGGTKRLLAFAGAALLLVSDSLLAYDRFARSLGRARILVLGTYFPAQLLIALSV